jgi:DNA-binding LacI/PurR family transcriptional regulator
MPAVNDPGAGADAFRRLASTDSPPTAVVTATDHLAIGALHAAHARGIAIPDQVSVVGFDDIPFAAYTAPPLTTVHNPITEMARLAVDLAIDRTSTETSDHVLRPSFTVRATTGAAPA